MTRGALAVCLLQARCFCQQLLELPLPSLQQPAGWASQKRASPFAHPRVGAGWPVQAQQQGGAMRRENVVAVCWGTMQRTLTCQTTSLPQSQAALQAQAPAMPCLVPSPTCRPLPAQAGCSQNFALESDWAGHPHAASTSGSCRAAQPGGHSCSQLVPGTQHAGRQARGAAPHVRRTTLHCPVNRGKEKQRRWAWRGDQGHLRCVARQATN